MKKILKFLLLGILSPAMLHADYSLQVDLDKPDAFYKAGESAVCTATLLKDGKIAAGERGRYRILAEGVEVKSGEFDAGQAVTVTGTLERPGWLYFGFEVLDEKGNAKSGKGIQKHRRKSRIVGEIGAMFDAEQIRSGIECPPDFDAFWARCRQELDKVPVQAELQPYPVPERYQGKIECYTVTVACAGRAPVTGYLAMPVNAAKGSLPAMVDFLSWSWCDASKEFAMNAAARGTLAFAASWHGLPAGKDAEFYREAGKKFDPRENDESPEKWVFHDVYLRVMRALDYLKTRPEWNGRELIAQGGSLGGAQCIAAAALDPAVTLAVVSVPCFCEFDAAKSGRKPSIPYQGRNAEKLHNSPAIAATMQYHDMVNLAPRIRCEIFVCTGFTDELCPPSNVFAFYNALSGTTRKTMYTNPRTGHYGTTKNVKGNERLAKYFNSITVQQYK